MAHAHRIRLSTLARLLRCGKTWKHSLETECTNTILKKRQTVRPNKIHIRFLKSSKRFSIFNYQIISNVEKKVAWIHEQFQNFLRTQMKPTKKKTRAWGIRNKFQYLINIWLTPKHVSAFDNLMELKLTNEKWTKIAVNAKVYDVWA